MNYRLLQKVRIVDMNNEVLTEVLFDHGSYESSALAVGATVICSPLGLKQFEVVYDKRDKEPARFKIAEVEIDLVQRPSETRVLLEPVTLIVGQHDVGTIE